MDLDWKEKASVIVKKAGLGELECETLVMVDGWWYDKIVRGF